MNDNWLLRCAGSLFPGFLIKNQAIRCAGPWFPLVVRGRVDVDGGIEEDDEIIGTVEVKKYTQTNLTDFNTQTAINDEVVGLIENDSTDEKPIGLITRKLSSVGTRFSLIIARLTRTSLSSEDVKAAELEKVSKVGA